MASLFQTLKKIPYLLLTLGLTIILFALYTFFDLRQGGTHLTIFSAHIMPLQFFLDHFGVLYVVTRIVLDLVLALLSALLIAVTIDNYRQGNSMFAGSACSTGATVILGLATFGCPSCVLPIAGTLGAVVTSQALPLFGFEFKLLSLLIVLGTLAWLLHRLRVPTQTVTVSTRHATAQREG